MGVRGGGKESRAPVSSSVVLLDSGRRASPKLTMDTAKA